MDSKPIPHSNPPKPPACFHGRTETSCLITYLEDSGQFMADFGVTCVECGEPFEFIGLPMGLNLFGATTDLTRTELRVAIVPTSKSKNPIKSLGFLGFSFNVNEDPQEGDSDDPGVS